VVLVFINIILVLLLLLNLSWKFSLFNFSTLFSLLYLIFYIFPAFDRIYDWNLVEFYLFEYDYGTLQIQNLVLIFNMIIALCFCVSFNLKFNFTKVIKIKNFNLDKKPSNTRIYFFLGSILLIVIYLLKGNWEGAIYELFLPSRKQGLITSGYIKLFAFMVPTALSFYVSLKKVKKRYFIYLICLAMIFISGQRKFIINFIFLIFLGESIGKNYNIKKIIKYSSIGVLLIPGIWYLRAIFSQIQRGTNFADLTYSRSIMYLIFGSPSSGFESILFYKKFENFLDLDFLISIKYIAFSFIPRFIFSDKPETISSIVKTKFNWSGNPSIFFTNELDLNFGYLAPIIAIFSGYMLAKLINKNAVYSILLLSGVMTLFKAGFSYYITESVFLIISFYLINKILISKWRLQ
jgi:hypothetical protein